MEMESEIKEEKDTEGYKEEKLNWMKSRKKNKTKR